MDVDMGVLGVGWRRAKEFSTCGMSATQICICIGKSVHLM